MTLEFLEDGDLYWKSTDKSTVSPLRQTIQYIHYTEENEPSTGNKTSQDTETYLNHISVKAGDVIEFYGNSALSTLNNASHYNYFSSTAKFKAYGNVNSMLIAKPSNDYLGDEDYLASQCATVTLGNYALKGLFAATESGRASNLQEAENLSMPSTTLAESCYEGMFKGCSAIPKAPVLPASAGANECYKEMFYGCSSLNYVKVLLSDPTSGSYTTNWLYGVAGSGSFLYKTGATWTTGVSGIPSGWTGSAVVE